MNPGTDVRPVRGASSLSCDSDLLSGGNWESRRWYAKKLDRLRRHSSTSAWVCGQAAAVRIFLLVIPSSARSQSSRSWPVFPAACLIDFIRATTDLAFEFFGIARHRRGWFSCRIRVHGGTSFSCKSTPEETKGQLPKICAVRGQRVWGNEKASRVRKGNWRTLQSFGSYGRNAQHG
jgi:hypothetical protein